MSEDEEKLSEEKSSEGEKKTFGEKLSSLFPYLLPIIILVVVVLAFAGIAYYIFHGDGRAVDEIGKNASNAARFDNHSFRNGNRSDCDNTNLVGCTK